MKQHETDEPRQSRAASDVRDGWDVNETNRARAHDDRLCMMFDLSGHTALVTGAGKGMGVGMARGLVTQGAAVIVNDLDPALAEERVKELVDFGGSAVAAAFDVTDLAAVQEGVAMASELLGSRVDILVNNAGIPKSAVSVTPFLDIAREDWAPYIDLNLYGSLHCIKVMAPGMVEQGWGRIVQISSGAGRVGLSIGQALHGASKSGIEGFIRHLSQELGPHGVTANALALGLMENVEIRNRELLRPLVAAIPNRRLGSLADVGAAVAFLASPEAGHLNGQTINLNGGATTN